MQIGFRNRALKRYAGKAWAIPKSVYPNAGNAVSYGYTGKASAGKSLSFDVGNAVWYCYAGKVGTLLKSA